MLTRGHGLTHTLKHGVNLLVDPPEKLVAYFNSIEANPEGREPDVVRGLHEDVNFLLETRFRSNGGERLSTEHGLALARARLKLLNYRP